RSLGSRRHQGRRNAAGPEGPRAQESQPGSLMLTRPWMGGAAARGYTRRMIHGAHVIIYSKDSEADRAFFRDVLKYNSVDAGHGWLIFALPPAEVAVHPSETNDVHELYFMCDDVRAFI